MEEPIGYIIERSTPFEAVVLLSKDYVPLYEYVYYESEEVPPGATEAMTVKVIAQVHEIYRVSKAPAVPFDQGEKIYALTEAIAETSQDLILAKIRVLGYIVEEDGRYKVYMPRRPPKIFAPVYKAPDQLLKRFYGVAGEKGLFIGYLITRPKVEVKLNMDGIRRHLAIIAATGSGKTWTSVLLIEELLKKGATILVIDPHGEYVHIARSLTDREVVEKRLKAPHLYGRVILLAASKKRALELRQMFPKVKVIPYKIDFRKLSEDELESILELPSGAYKMRLVSHAAHKIVKLTSYITKERKFGSIKYAVKLLQYVVDVIKRTPRGKDPVIKKEEMFNVVFGLDYASLKQYDEKRFKLLEAAIADLSITLSKRDIEVYRNVIRKFKMLQRYGVYSVKTTPIRELLKPACITVFDVSGVSKSVQDHLVANLLTRVFRARERYKKGMLSKEFFEYPVVVIVEEAHNFAPPKSKEYTWSYEAISRIAAEGRKFGVFLIVITQRPSKIDPDVLSQCQSQIILRITNPADQEAIRHASERVSKELLENLPGLNVGEAIVVGPLSPTPVMIRLRDRVLEYGGADIDVCAEWRRALSAVSSEVRLRDVLVKIVSRMLNVELDNRVVEEAFRIASFVKEVKYDPSSRLIYGVLDISGRNISVEIDGEGEWSCSHCGAKASLEPCPHVVAVAFKAIESGRLRVGHGVITHRSPGTG